MKVKMLRSVGSAKGVHQPGHIVDLEEKMAVAWIEAGLAEEVSKKESKIKSSHETKVVAPEEKKTGSRSAKKKTDKDVTE
ncbi:hypothetical protein [Bacillus sp. PK3_68]|uniref:hypothetical protein n=1 Tax=Bacillus sp. PK3_68 TaxID=2027408 RepID=UPI00115F280F|nr:hypothetical protein [Bacillus sp. PK3_68]